MYRNNFPKKNIQKGIVEKKLAHGEQQKINKKSGYEEQRNVNVFELLGNWAKFKHCWDSGRISFLALCSRCSCFLFHSQVDHVLALA